MKAVFAKGLEWPEDGDLWRGADRTICCLYADAPRPFAFLQSQGFDAEHHVCRCAYDGGRADWLRLGGIFGQALHAASDKRAQNQELARAAGQLIARRYLPNLSVPPIFGKCGSKNPAKLFEQVHPAQ